MAIDTPCTFVKFLQVLLAFSGIAEVLSEFRGIFFCQGESWVGFVFNLARKTKTTERNQILIISFPRKPNTFDHKQMKVRKIPQKQVWPLLTAPFLEKLTSLEVVTHAISFFLSHLSAASQFPSFFPRNFLGNSVSKNFFFLLTFRLCKSIYNRQFIDHSKQFKSTSSISVLLIFLIVRGKIKKN